jgi:hypothetical protein
MRAKNKYLQYFLFVSWQVFQTCLVLFFFRAFLALGFPLFEQIILASFASAALGFLFLFLRSKMSNYKLNFDEFFSLIIISSLLSVLILPLSLVNIDRSRSFYVLSWVEKGLVSKEKGALEFKIESTEALDRNGVELRLNEQIQRGLVVEKGGIFHLTQTGRLLMSLSNLLSEIFKLENWDLNKS